MNWKQFEAYVGYRSAKDQVSDYQKARGFRDVKKGEPGRSKRSS